MLSQAEQSILSGKVVLVTGALGGIGSDHLRLPAAGLACARGVGACTLCGPGHLLSKPLLLRDRDLADR